MGRPSCDDCAFAGLPTDPGFDPIGDGLTETVGATLTLIGLSVNSEGLIGGGGQFTVVPEPGSAVLLGLCLLGIASTRRR